MRKEKKGEMESESLSEEERRALRGSKFAPLPTSQPSRTQSRLAHPGGPLATNKAAALAKFLERKLQEPNGLISINPALLEVAVKNAKETVNASGTSNSGRIVRHVASFGDDSEDSGNNGENLDKAEEAKGNTNKKKNKRKKDSGNDGENIDKAEETKGKTYKKKNKRKKVVTKAVKSKRKLKS